MKQFPIGAAVFISAFIVFSLFLGSSQQDIPARAPLNPDFIQFMDNIQKGIPYLASDDGHPLGYVPPPVALPPADIAGNRVLGTYPATYDLRTTGKLSPIRDQKSCGSCWTFGTYASLESKLRPGEARDFSEQDLNATHGFDYAECAGGNSYISQAYLARWSGPLSETDVPYPYAPGYSPVKHVQQVVWLPARASSADNDAIKDFVMNHGAAYCAFYWYSTNYNAATYSYYYPSSHTSNHAVAVVGWDDNYAAGNFSPAAPGNGAFIIRNSWGAGWGQSGYFYISYYDATIGAFASFNNAEATSNYSSVYMYDPLGYVSNWGYSNTIAWGANIFTASSNDPISAVGFVTNDKNTQYVVNLYAGVTAGDPSSGTLAATKSGTNPYPGYYTVVLDTPVAVTTGHKFSVVVKFQNSTLLYPCATEDNVSGYSSAATSNAGESFISPNGTSSWTDFFGLGGNCCIKAFSSPASVPSMVQKHAVGDFDGDGADEAAMDFGTLGAWMLNAGAWTQLSANDPENMVAFDIDGNGDKELAVDLGSLGLWMWNGGVWSQLSVNNAEYLIAADTNDNGIEELIIDFGAPGLRWRQESGYMFGMTGVDPQNIIALDIDNNGRHEVVADFGTTGLWIWDAAGSTWNMMTAADANTMAALDAFGFGNEGVAAGLNTLGIWLWDSGMWGQLSGVSADDLISGKMVLGGGSELAVDFGPVGLWLWASSVWTQLSGVNADDLIAADINGNGTDEVAGDFATLGLWLWSGGAWTQLSGVNPQGMLAGDIDGDVAKELIVDFGSMGVWMYNAGTWSQISALNPD